MDRQQEVWSSDLVVRVTNSGGSTFDFNPLSIAGFCAGARFRSMPRGIHKRYCEDHARQFDASLHTLARNVAEFVRCYAPGGRTTIAKALQRFLRFQAEKGFLLGADDGIDEYARHLHRLHTTKQLRQSEAVAILSIANQFLIRIGERSSAYVYQFGTADKAWATAPSYTHAGFAEVVRTLFTIYETSRQTIVEHIEKSEKGLRAFRVNDVVLPLSYTSACGTHELEVLNTNPAFHFVCSALHIFLIFTWGNASTAVRLDLDEIDIEEDGAETSLIYKGRAQKFIRLNIGVSSVEGDRAGYKWLKDFLSVRRRFVAYLRTKEHCSFSDESLFFAIGRDSHCSRMPLGRVSYINRHPLVREARRRGIALPSIDPRATRKFCEQLTDSALRNPLVITEKAQHEWDTYAKHYAKGNPIDARRSMTEALKLLQASGVSRMTFARRRRMAREHGIQLELRKPQTASLLNGLGCKRHEVMSAEEERFFRHQRSFGRQPTVCANLGQCVDCENCAVIEDPDAIYHLLSFREMLTLAKPTYVSSATALAEYEMLLAKIDLRLMFLDPKQLARAERRLTKDGLAEPWRL